MLSHLFLIVLAAVPGVDREEAGEVSTTVGSLVIHRGDRDYAGAPGAAIFAGDRIETATGGRATIVLDEGHVVLLGASTSAVLGGRPDDRTLGLISGEIRVTAGGPGTFSVEAGTARAVVRRGILRADAEGSRFRVERGIADIRAEGRAPVRLAEGREVTLGGAGARPMLVSNAPGAWAIRADDVAGLLLVQGADAKPVDPAKPKPKPTTPTPNPKPKPDAEGLKEREPKPKPTTPNPDPDRPAMPVAPDDTEPTRSGAIPPTGADAARSATGQPLNEDADAAANRPYQPIAVSQPTSFSSLSLSLGGISASSSAAGSGAIFSDAQQDSRNLMFPGNINLVTAKTDYLLSNVRLKFSDRFSDRAGYYSIGVGASPTGQVSTDLRTGSNLMPTVIRIPRTVAYLVKLDQFGIQDPAANPATGTPGNSSSSAVGTFGFLGAKPIAPQVRGAQPLADTRARFNDRLTFALGEFKLTQQGNNPVLSIRRSDQDRQIIKAVPRNDNKDMVTPNPDVHFTQIQDAKFFPDVPKVFVPAAGTPDNPTLRRLPTFGSLDFVRKAATTTLVADSLFAYSKRTGQTRFVIDNRVVDIAGYRRPADPLLRTGHAAPGMAGGPSGSRHHDVSAAARRSHR